MESICFVLFFFFNVLYNTNSNITSFVGCINNVVIQLYIYFNSHMRILEQIISIIPGWFYVFIQDRGAYKHKNACFVYLHIMRCFSPEQVLNIISIDFGFCNVSSSSDVVYKERLSDCHKLVIYLFYNLVCILILLV